MPQPPGKLVTHPNGQKTHYIVDDFTDPWRPKETILIQHGFARHSAFWYHWVPALARRYRVIRRDNRGHGYSSHPTDTSYKYSSNTICEEIIDLLDQLGVEKVHFLGESTSGMVGIILAAKYPDRLHSLVICSTPTWLPPAALTFFAFGEKDWPTACRKLGSRGWGQRLGQVPGTVGSTDPNYVQWWVDQIAVSSGEGLAGYAEFLSDLDARPYLSQVKVPMLILAPANSAVISLEDQELVKNSVPRAKMVVIDGAGHEIYLDKAEECQKAMLEFLNCLRR